MQNFKGTIDYNNDDWNQMTYIINTIRKWTKLLNVQEIDTPIIENDNLLTKFNELESKNIYKLDHTTAFLRYDLTIPLMRYVLNNRITNFRRFQVGKVFRRELPYIQSGRFREFYQADLDIIGEYTEMESEIEIIWLINKVLQELNVSDYTIKYNYRSNLETICNMIDITNKSKIKDICRTIDKLDKQDWDVISIELKNIRHLSIKQIDTLKSLLDQNYLAEHLNDCDTTLNTIIGGEKLVFDATLARGLDYYTGIIYEVVVIKKHVKTIIAGGRYDRLIYCNTKVGKKYIPAIGVSFGISRIHCILPKLELEEQNKVYLICEDHLMRIKLLCVLRDKKLIVTTNNYKSNNKKIITLISKAVANHYTWIVIYGENNHLIKIKNLKNICKDRLVDYNTLCSRTHILI